MQCHSVLDASPCFQIQCSLAPVPTRASGSKPQPLSDASPRSQSLLRPKILKILKILENHKLEDEIRRKTGEVKERQGRPSAFCLIDCCEYFGNRERKARVERRKPTPFDHLHWRAVEAFWKNTFQKALVYKPVTNLFYPHFYP